MYPTIQRLYKPNEQWADCLLFPQRYCHRQWENLTACNLSDSGQIAQVAYLIASFIPLVIATLISYLLLPVGLLLKACTEEKTLKNSFFLYTGEDLSKLEKRVAVSKEAELAFKAGAPLSACATNTHFFYGACDADLEAGASDLGWGCAWRCIQTLLASHGIFYRFNDLYTHYRLGSTSNEWAEPGYGAKVCQDLEISHQLYLYHYTKTPKTAVEAFNKTELMTFEQLTAKLFEHFNKQQTPVMIDDGAYAYTLLGGAIEVRI